MRVLVTRPRHQSEHLIKELEARGHQADLLPLLDIKPVTVSAAEQQSIIEQLENATKIIAVSANAANLALPFLGALSNSKEFFAVGPSTAKSLVEQGYKVQIPDGEYNSESLLALPEFFHVKQQNIVLLCGEGGRDYLEQELKKRGANVERVELYTREPIADNLIDADKLSTPEVLTAMSGDTVKALNAVLENSDLSSWKSLPLIVPSRRVENIASENGFTKIHSSQKPTTESLLEVLDRVNSQ